jgi:conserved oligomeric Golgi complex subunit 3
MYEDPWYNFVPEAHSKQEDGHTQKSQHRRRESLLKQPSVGSTNGAHNSC